MTLQALLPQYCTNAYISYLLQHSPSHQDTMPGHNWKSLAMRCYHGSGTISVPPTNQHTQHPLLLLGGGWARPTAHLTACLFPWTTGGTTFISPGLPRGRHQDGIKCAWILLGEIPGMQVWLKWRGEGRKIGWMHPRMPHTLRKILQGPQGVLNLMSAIRGVPSVPGMGPPWCNSWSPWTLW